MEYTILGAALGLCFSVLAVVAYERGIRTGMRMVKGIEPAPIQTPLAAIAQRTEAKKDKAADDLTAQGIENLFSYTGKPQAGGE